MGSGKPAVGGKRLGIGPWIVVVAKVDAWSIAGNLSLIAARDIIPGRGKQAQTHPFDAAPNRAIDLFRIVGQARVGMVTRFQHSVELDQVARHSSLAIAQPLHWTGCAASDDDPQR